MGEEMKIVFYKDDSFRIVDESWEYESDIGYDTTIEIGEVFPIYVHPKNSPYHAQVFTHKDMEMDNNDGRNQFMNECQTYLPAHAFVEKLKLLRQLEDRPKEEGELQQEVKELNGQLNTLDFQFKTEQTMRLERQQKLAEQAEQIAELTEALRIAADELYTTSRATVFDGDRIQSVNAVRCGEAFELARVTLAKWGKK